MYNWHAGNKNNLKTIEAQIVQKLKNNEARPKFAGSYKNRRVLQNLLSQVAQTRSTEKSVLVYYWK